MTFGRSVRESPTPCVPTTLRPPSSRQFQMQGSLRPFKTVALFVLVMVGNVPNANCLLCSQISFHCPLTPMSLSFCSSNVAALLAHCLMQNHCHFQLINACAPCCFAHSHFFGFWCRALLHCSHQCFSNLFHCHFQFHHTEFCCACCCCSHCCFECHCLLLLQ